MDRTPGRPVVHLENIKASVLPADERTMGTAQIAATSDALAAANAVASAICVNIESVIRGKRREIALAVTAVVSGGHLLVEDVPGVGKTLLAKSLARSIGGSFRRVQGTPDLLPADLTGVSVLDPKDGSWRFRPGPLFANVVLVDEINRATPRTQSALLEAMEERQVSTDGGTLPLPDPFVVIATQNPHEHAGTFALVEAQRDRFAMVLELGLPGREAEREILTGDGGVDGLRRLHPTTDGEGLRTVVAAARAVHVAPVLTDYLLDVVDATRTHEGVELGASPRASLNLLRAAQAHALVAGRGYVTPDDIKAVAAATLAHRLILTGGQDLLRGRAVVEGILRRTPAPRG